MIGCGKVCLSKGLLICKTQSSVSTLEPVDHPCLHSSDRQLNHIRASRQLCIVLTTQFLYIGVQETWNAISSDQWTNKPERLFFF